KVHETVPSLLHVPGAKLARPRRSIVLRRLEPNWEKSHVRPSWPPKSAWQDAHESEAPSRAVLVTSPWWTGPSWGSRFQGGIGPWLPAASRAEVVKRILPSRISGGSGSLVVDGPTQRTSGMHSVPLGQSRRVEQGVDGAPWQRNPSGVAATAATFRA